tara:strand:- start:400 stop:558 length:159 start_codon:yes stop_codon:yes gene_type:complete
MDFHLVVSKLFNSKHFKLFVDVRDFKNIVFPFHEKWKMNDDFIIGGGFFGTC